MDSARHPPRANASRLFWQVFNVIRALITFVWSIGWISAALLLRYLTGDTRLPLRMGAWGWSRGLMLLAGGRLRVEGADSIDWSKPYLLVSNHQSMLDICAVFLATPVPMRFLFSAHTLRWPFVGWYGKAMDMPVIDRENPRSAPLMLRHIARLLGEGRSVCLFPEGTRSRDGQVLPFKAGPFEAARMAGVQILPVAIAGAGKVMRPREVTASRPGPILLTFGTPIAPDAHRNTLAAHAQAQVCAMMGQPFTPQDGA